MRIRRELVTKPKQHRAFQVALVVKNAWRIPWTEEPGRL